MTDPLIVDKLSVLRGEAALVALDATISPGEILTLMGPSGIGKSTLLAAINGTLPLGFSMRGHVRLGNKTLTDQPIEKRRIGILFQDPLLFPHMSVGGNLAFALPPGGRRQARRARIARALEEVGLDGMIDRDPATLSGGQAARVALLRCLLAEPRALLLDEPFSRLDTTLRDRIRNQVFDAARARGLPVVMVTHDPGDARAAAGPVHHLS